MKKREKKDNAIKKYPWRRYAIMSGAVVGLALLTFVAARYRTFFKSGDGQMTSKEFYFTTDLLGDEAMVAKTGGELGQYEYEDVQEGEWHLYGGGAHKISINLRNYYDELRVTEDNIEYTASVNVLDSEGKPAEGMDDLATLTIGAAGENPTKTGEQTQSETTVAGTLTADPQGEGVEKELQLKIQSHKDMTYEEGTAVEVNIQSTSPYEKEMKLHFTLYKVDTFLRYEIRDKVNSPYAEMIIMTNVVNSNETGESGGTSAIQPYLEWSEDLSIDNTNSMTFTYKDGKFTQVENMETNKIRISSELNAGESRSIYFFKNNTEKDYSTEEIQTVDPGNDGTYVIQIGII